MVAGQRGESRRPHRQPRGVSPGRDSAASRSRRSTACAAPRRSSSRICRRRWVSMLEHTLAEAKRLGLGVDMANGTGWPFGGPNVGDADAAKYVALEDVRPLRGGERLRDTIALVQTPLVRAVNGRVDIAQLARPDRQQRRTSRRSRSIRCASRSRCRCSPLMAYSKAGDVVDLTHARRRRRHARLDRARRRVDALRASSRAGTASRSSAPRPAARATSSTTSRAQPITHYLEPVRSGVRRRRPCAACAASSTTRTRWTTRAARATGRRGCSTSSGRAAATICARTCPRCSTAARPDSARRVLSDYRQTVSDLVLDGFTEDVGRLGARARRHGPRTRRTARRPTSSISTPRPTSPRPRAPSRRASSSRRRRRTSPASASPRPKRRRGSPSTSSPSSPTSAPRSTTTSSAA